MNYTEFLEFLDEETYAIGLAKYKKKDDEEKKRLDKDKARMQYGKSGKPTGEKLGKGEYKYFDKNSQQWVSAAARPNRMNYSKFVEEISSPEYQIEGKTPKCRKGYRWDKNIGGCVPIGSPTKDEKGTNIPTEMDGYNVIGSNGMDGGYALEDGPRKAPWRSSI
jgi:hypothetical protein